MQGREAGTRAVSRAAGHRSPFVFISQCTEAVVFHFPFTVMQQWSGKLSTYRAVERGIELRSGRKLAGGELSRGLLELSPRIQGSMTILLERSSKHCPPDHVCRGAAARCRPTIQGEV